MRKSKLSRRITWRVIGIVSFFNVIIVGIIAVFIFVLSLENGGVRGQYVADGKKAMTIDKNLKDMAYNTAMIVNGLISNSPVRTSQSISGIPAIYSKITVMTKDNY